MEVYSLNKENRSFIMEKFQELISTPFKMTMSRSIEQGREALNEKAEFEEKGQLTIECPFAQPSVSTEGILFYCTFQNPKGIWHDGYYEGEEFIFSTNELAINKINDYDFKLIQVIRKI